MLTLSLMALLAGAALGMRFKVLVLVPTIFLTLLALLAVGISAEGGFSFIALAMVVAATCLQLGYLIAVGARYAVAAARAGRIQRIWHGRPASVR